MSTTTESAERDLTQVTFAFCTPHGNTLVDLNEFREPTPHGVVLGYVYPDCSIKEIVECLSAIYSIAEFLQDPEVDNTGVLRLLGVGCYNYPDQIAAEILVRGRRFSVGFPLCQKLYN